MKFSVFVCGNDEGAGGTLAAVPGENQDGAIGMVGGWEMYIGSDPGEEGCGEACDDSGGDAWAGVYELCGDGETDRGVFETGGV